MYRKDFEIFDSPLTPDTGGQSIDVTAVTSADVIVTTTNGLVSDIIRAVTSGPVSHVMVSVGNGQVVEAVRDGVREISLRDALLDATLAVVFRRSGISTGGVDTVVANVRSVVGDTYNNWGVVQRLLTEHVGAIREVPIATDSFYCSQLVLTAFDSAGFPLLTSGDISAWPTNLVDVGDFGESLLEYVGHLIA
ncbi:MAG: hypothetical protein AAFN40_17315 [Cyanobacteria bacterium J06560_6]